MRKIRFAFLMIFAAAASPALSHTGSGTGGSFLSGFLHPLSGGDHVLAMVAVGLWGRLLGGPALIALPAAFMAAMLAGGVMAMAGWTLPAVEAGIAASVLGLWALILFRARPPVLIGTGVCAVFAVAHGYAHGAEMATGSIPVQYAAGFLIATAVLLLIGSGLPRRVGGAGREA